MSYHQAMRWAKKHPRGTKQPMIFSTGSGFWPSMGWIEHDWNPYVEACAQAGITPMGQEELYRLQLRGNRLSGQSIAACVEYTQIFKKEP